MSSTTLNGPSTAAIEHISLGIMPYHDALVRQVDQHRLVQDHPEKQLIFTVEHPPVLTFGKNSDPSHLLFSRDFFRQTGVEIIETERGGQVTAHMPGQLVVYPILHLKVLNLSVRQYVGILEDSVIAILNQYNIPGHRDPAYPGVWIEHEKICALGVRIKNHVSMHGLALNVSNDLSLFGKIVPCGIKGRGVTSLSKILSRDVNVVEVSSLLVGELTDRLNGYSTPKKCHDVGLCGDLVVDHI